MRILVVEDDVEAAETMARGLAEAGHDVVHQPDGAAGLAAAKAGGFDVVIMDRMMPTMDGITAIQEMRRAGLGVPVLVLSALGAVDDRVVGLRAGGDDYLTKPYALSELVARLEALGRRGQTAAAPQTKLRVGDLEMDLLSRSVVRAGQEIDLQPREFMLLEYLMRNAGAVVTRTMLLENVWEYHFDPQTNVIDVHISRLRQKIDKAFPKPLLHTVRGSGYCLKPAE